MLDIAKITKPMLGLYAIMAAVHNGAIGFEYTSVRFRDLHPLAAYSRANVGIKRTIGNILNLTEHLNLTIERELVAGGTQTSNSLH